jgi:cell division protein FtsQ
MKSNRRRKKRMTPKRQFRLPWIRINFKALLLGPSIVAAVLAGCAGTKVLLDQELTTLVLEGRFQRVTAAQLEATLAPERAAGFLSVDLENLVQRVEALDWVDDVRIQRRWPDALVVQFTEHLAAARWGESGLLNVRGELFTQHARTAFPELPQLSGPPGSEQRVGALYAAMRGRLIEAGLNLASLSLDERGAWRLELSGGQQIRIGHRNVGQRLERLFEVALPGLGFRFDEVAYIDLRYTNGFAVGWVPGSQLGQLTLAEGQNGRG